MFTKDMVISFQEVPATRQPSPVIMNVKVKGLSTCRINAGLLNWYRIHVSRSHTIHIVAGRVVDVGGSNCKGVDAPSTLGVEAT